MESLFHQSIDKDTYDSWEKSSLDEQKNYALKKLAQICKHASETTPFYKDKLSGLDLKSSNPLKSIQPLLPTDLRAGLPPKSETLLSEKTIAYNVFQSGGTTGDPKSSLFTHRELEKLNFSNARGFFACGLTDQDKAANMWAVGSLYMTFVHIHRMLQQYGSSSFPFSNNTNNAFIYGVVEKFGINCLTGVASIMLTFLNELSDEQASKLKLEKIYYGGEHLYENDRKDLKERFGIKTILAPGYGTVDTWYLGYQCHASKEGVFHAHNDQVYLEVLDPETLEPCAENEIGILYATVFERTLTPIIRYQVGDRVKFLTNKCSCGRNTPLFQLYGRGDDILRIGYDSVQYNDILKIASLMPEFSGAMKIVKRRFENKDQLNIYIETKRPHGDTHLMNVQFINHLYKNRPTLKEMISKHLISELKVNIVEPNSLERNTKTGKLIRVTDESR